MRNFQIKFFLLGFLVLVVLARVRPLPPFFPEFLAVPVDIVLHQGDNLQTAINNATCGDTITLDAGAEFVGTFTLPNKACSSYITIRSSALTSLPAGVRVSPSNVGSMPRIRTNIPNDPAFKTATAAHHFRFQGLEITNTTGVFSDGAIVSLGSNPKETSLSQITHDFDFDRCYIHGQPTLSNQQGILANAQDVTVQNSYISEIHYIGADSQAILTYNSPGGLHIINNYLEAAGENFLAGGADPGVPNLVPGMTGGIEIRRNFFFKPLSWKVGDPSYAGIHWTVKNLLELKNAMNVVIDGNIFQNNWVDGQAGIPILFTVRNQDCTAPWSTIQNVSFTNNTITGAKGVVNLLGKDNEAEPAFGKCPAGTGGSVRGTNLTMANNLFYNNSSEAFLILNGFYNLTLNHNTNIPISGNTATLYGEDSLGFVWQNHMTIYTLFGIVGDAGGGQGTTALNNYTPGFVWQKNVIVGSPPAENPSGTCGGITCYPDSVSTVQFVNFVGGDYALLPSSPYHNAGTDGTDIGVNMPALLAAQATSSEPSVNLRGKVTLGGKVGP